MTATGDPLDLGPPGPVLGLRAFRCGQWNDVPTTPEDIGDLAANYEAFLAGDPPFYVPFVSINHDNGLSFGRVTRCEADGECLDLDLDGVPQAVRRWMRSDQLTAPSIEFWDAGQFVGPDGAKWPTRVLKCCTLLGNDAPGVKGLPPLSAATYPGLDDAATDEPATRPIALTPAALTQYRPAEGVSKFSDQAPATRSGGRRMNPDRQKWIDALVAAGFPAELFTDAIPDPFLQAMLAFVQKAAQPQEMGDDLADKPKAMADCDKPKAMSDDTADDADKDEGVQKYRDATGRPRTVRVPKALAPMAAAFAAQMDTLHATNAANAAALARQARAGRQARVKAFRDEMTKPDARTNAARMTPAQFDALEPMLLASDDAGVRKFADGKTDGTELEERFAAIRTSFAGGVRTFADAMPNAPAARPLPPLAPGQTPKASDISDEVKAMIAAAGYGHHLASLK